VMLAAGLDGIERGLELPADVTDDVYAMTQAERDAHGIGMLPGDLDEAIVEMEKSKLVREALGDQVFEYILRNKRAEWMDYHTRVTPYELEAYLPLL